MPKILFIDIETRPALVYVWGAYKQDIYPDQVLEPTGILCFAAKYLGEKEVYFHSTWGEGKKEMLKNLLSLLSEADAVVSYNGERFDLPIIVGECLKEGLPPPPPPTSIDVLKAVKKFGFMINKLGFVGPLLKVGKKVKNAGFPLWIGVLEGNIKDQKKMEKYNVGDVILLEKLYLKVKHFIGAHPYLGEGTGCPSCGSHNLHKRGFRRTRYFKIQRLQCQDCGAWSEGKKEKIT